MSMLSSYALLSGARPLPGKLSREALQLRRQPAASVALPCVPIIPSKQSRAPRFICYADNKNTYSIQPGALVHPTPEPKGLNWKIMDDHDHINLMFDVGESTSTDKLEVAVEDQVLLIIKYKGDPNEDSPASKLNVRLLMPPGYDGKMVTASIVPVGWLQIIIAKPKHELHKIDITKK